MATKLSVFGSMKWGKAVFILALLLVFTSCASNFKVLSDTELEAQLASTDITLAQVGASQFDKTENVFVTRRSKEMDYEVYTPKYAVSKATIFVAHGFLRSLSTMRGWAEHLASYGYRTVILSFVNSSIFGGNHDLNAEDMMDLAAKLAGDGGRIYMGFSAGGLSALLAASQDPLSISYIGLDAVDSSGLGAKGLRGLKVSSLFLWAAAGPCNANNNAKVLLEQTPSLMGSNILSFAFEMASHAHFELPYSPDAASFCGGIPSPVGTKLVMDAIRATVTSYILLLEIPLLN